MTTIALPFPYTLYDQSFTSINLSSNGNAQFVHRGYDLWRTCACRRAAHILQTIFP